jgi:hypothetical protein
LLDRPVAACEEIQGGRVMLISDQLFHDVKINSADNRLFASRVFGWFAGAACLTVEPRSGTLPGGSTINLAVDVDASIITDGIYRHRIDIRTNDPGRPLLSIPVYIKADTSSSVTGIDDGPGDAPRNFALHANYPNPFNPETVIAYDLPVACRVRVLVYDVGGKMIRRLADENRPSGRHSVQWNGRNSEGEPVASGVYFYKIIAGDFVETRKMVLLK